MNVFTILGTGTGATSLLKLLYSLIQKFIFTFIMSQQPGESVNSSNQLSLYYKQVYIIIIIHPYVNSSNQLSLYYKQIYIIIIIPPYVNSSVELVLQANIHYYYNTSLCQQQPSAELVLQVNIHYYYNTSNYKQIYIIIIIPPYVNSSHQLSLYYK